MSKANRRNLRSLVGRCLQGDEKAWLDLVEMLDPIVMSICFGMRLTRDESFEIRGQVYLLLLENLHKLKSRDKLLAYVSTMTKREVREYLRKSNYLNYMSTDIKEAIYSRDIWTPDVILEISEASEDLMKAMAKLDLLSFKLLTALFLDRPPSSYESISQRLGIPVSSIGPTRIRCLKKLKKIMGDKK